jgi:hypothetical protein
MNSMETQGEPADAGRCSPIEEPKPGGRLKTVPPVTRGNTGLIGRPAPRAVALGVLLDGTMQEGWVLASLRQALAVPGVRLAAVALARGHPRATFASRLHRLLDRIDGRLRCRNEPLLAAADATAELAAPLIDVETGGSAEGWFPTEAGVATLRLCEADVWLCFTAAPPRRSLPPVSRYGVWGLEIGHGIPAARNWAGANEVGGGSPVTMVSVVDYTQTGNGVLYRSFGATVRNSIGRNRLGCLRKGMSFFRRLLEHLTRDGDAWRSPRPATAAVPPRYPAQRQPTLPSLFRLSWRLVSSVVANRLRALRRLDQWQIAYYFADEGEAGCRHDRLRYLVPPRDRFWADPFAIEHEGRHFIFFEELHYRTRKGRIAAVEVFEDAAPGEPQVVLERPYHLSYPFLFAWEGSLYMLPETAENGTVELYRCEAFPSCWRRHRVLLEGIRAYDATLWRGHDRWWMFASVAEPGADSSDELHLYWGATPLGPWTAHRGNPVLSDARCARPAGPLFSRDGKLYRPSQDCSPAYGHAVSINRVDALRDDEYRETAVHRITPGWRKDVLRVHTYGGNGRLRVIDCLIGRKRRLGDIAPERYLPPMS